MLALGILVGIALYVWLYKTKTGMVIRAGVDDRQMTAALGINIQTVFAIAFVVGAGLAGLGAVVGTSQGNVAQLQDGQWLLYSLVVVIVGGMGSLFGAVAGSLLYGIVFMFSAAYLPTTGQRLLHAVLDRLHVRAAGARARVPAAGALREGRVTQPRAEAADRAGDRCRSTRLRSPRPDARRHGHLDRSDPHADPDLRARGRQPHLPVRVRRDDLADTDGADGDRRLRDRQHGLEGRRGRRDEGARTRLGSDGLGCLLAIAITVVVAFVFGAIASRSYGIYFLMLTLTFGVIANLFFGS